MAVIRDIALASAAAVMLSFPLLGLAADARADGLLNTKRISSALAGEAVASAVQACAEKKYTVSAVLVDADGVQQAALRGDGTGPDNMFIANDKAYTALSFQTDTAEMVGRPNNAPPPSVLAKIPHLVLAAGGVVIKVGDQVIGALGVSGAPGGDNDALCAKTGLDKVRDRLK
jgi:uncharacterized protein GlcG (DUF336 family)